MLGVADHSPAVLSVLLDRTQYRMVLLDDLDTFKPFLGHFQGFVPTDFLYIF
jgi:hypothetical protein